MPDQTKDRIVDAAYRALVKRGYHETSMKDIAAEAGFAPGLAHYYFETKEDLLVAAIERACQPVMDAWRQAGMNLSGPLPEDADPMMVARMGFELAKEELRLCFSRRSRLVATQFTWKDTVDRLVAEYTSLPQPVLRPAIAG